MLKDCGASYGIVSLLDIVKGMSMSQAQPSPCALCGRVHQAMGVVTLNGREVCTYSEEWKAECELRTVMRFPDKARKPKVTKLMYLDMVEKERGYPTRKAMRDEMVKRYREKK